MTHANLIFAPLPVGSPRFIDVTGQTFSKLKVVGYAGADRSGKQVRHRWWCRCECGNLVHPRTDALRNGNTTSCGCAQRIAVGNASRKHGHASRNSRRGHSNVYGIWCGIIQRCCNSENNAYRHYGGRGIVMCDRWRNSFQAFIDDMGPRPAGGSIDRIDMNGNYAPGNCRWATRQEQLQNTRRNHFITFRGDTLCVTEWARRLGLPSAVLFGRLMKSKWDIERALTTPIQKQFSRS